MIFEFNLPCIVDTKNLYSTFTKKKFVAKEYIPKIKKISKQRKALKETLKYLLTIKLEENIPYNLIDEAISYAEVASELDSIFDRNYQISKNWKWTPFLTPTKILKYSQTIKCGKSGEIIMSRYTAFAACFRPVRADIAFIKRNILYKQNLDLYNEMTFSALMKKTPTVNKLEETIPKVLKVHVKAWMLLKRCYDSSGPLFNNLANYSERYIENTSSGMEITLMLTKINTNILYIEYLRLQGNHEEMGKYAKMIVTQAFLVIEIIKTQGFFIDASLLEFLQVCQRLFKAVALWSLLFPYSAKLHTGTFTDGEDMNVLAGGCNSIVKEIGKLHKDILGLQNFKNSLLFPYVQLYFTDILVAKGLEITNLYSEVYAGYQYDDFHFEKMMEIDYIGRAIGDENA